MRLGGPGRGKSMNNNKELFHRMHKLGHIYAETNINTEIDRFEKQVFLQDGAVTYNKEAIVKELGRLMVVAYAKGYADCVENKEVSRRILI